MTDVFDIHQGPSWNFVAQGSTVLKSTTLKLTLNLPSGPRPVQFAEGPDVVPLHTAA